LRLIIPQRKGIFRQSIIPGAVLLSETLQAIKRLISAFRRDNSGPPSSAPARRDRVTIEFSDPRRRDQVRMLSRTDNGADGVVACRPYQPP
jgi:hypothetical protein